MTPTLPAAGLASRGARRCHPLWCRDAEAAWGHLGRCRYRNLAAGL